MLLDKRKYRNDENVTAVNLDEVSSICKQVSWCKSKFLSEDSFSVETWSEGKGTDPRRVFIEEKVEEGNKTTKMDSLLQRSGFFDELHSACKEKRGCKVVIKPNISIAVQKELLNYTDPELVDWLVERVKKDGIDDVTVAESQNALSLVKTEHEPVKISKNIGYKNEVVNLSSEPSTPVPYKDGKITIANRLRDADFIINFPKGRSHLQRRMTGALKNMYGTIPDVDKFTLYHWKGNGVSMEDAAVAVNHSTPSDFTIIDMINTVDGEDEHISFTRIEKGISPGLLIAGKDPLAIDKAIAMKMGYEDQNEPPVTKAEVEFRGDFDVRKPGIVDGSLEHISVNGKKWEKPKMNWLYSFLIDEALKIAIKFVPFSRQGMAMVGNLIYSDVV